MVRKSKRGTQFRQWANKVLYLFGASLKDAGKKLFAYIKMQETPATELKLTIIGAQRSPFLCPLRHDQTLFPLLCRKSLPLSQQIRQESG